MLRKASVAVALVTLALVAASCTSGGEGTDPDTGVTGDTGDTIGQQDPGQLTEIVILAEDVPATLDVDGAAIGAPTSQTGIVNTVEPLIYFPDGEINDEGIQLLDFNNFEGRLAESWEFDAATLTWTFNLREGVIGCDGATFDADDVIYTFERGKSVSSAVPHLWFLSNVMSIAGFTTDVFDEGADRSLGTAVQKIDQYTVTIQQEAVNQLFLPVLAHFGMAIFDKETMEAQATADDPWSHDFADNEGIGAFGPYCVERWEKDSEFVVVANPDYYRGAPSIDRIVYRKVPASANRVAALISGDADLVEHLTPKEFAALRSQEGVKVGGVFGNETLFVQMNWANPPFDDPLVRKAVAFAIPYDEVIATGYIGQARKWNGVVPSTYPGYYEPDNLYEYDPQMAKQLLAEAGYPDGEGLEAYADAFELTYVAERESTLGPIATVISNALIQVGFPVVLNPMPQTQYADRQFVKFDLPFVLNDAEKPIGVDSLYAVLIAFISREFGPPANQTNYSNATVDELAFEAKVETDPDRREQLLADIQQLVYEDVNWLPVVEWKTQWAYRDSIGGVSWNSENSLRWYDLTVEE